MQRNESDLIPNATNYTECIIPHAENYIGFDTTCYEQIVLLVLGGVIVIGKL